MERENKLKRLKWYDWFSLLFPFAIFGFGIYVVKYYVIHPLDIGNILFSFMHGVPFFLVALWWGARDGDRIVRKVKNYEK